VNRGNVAAGLVDSALRAMRKDISDDELMEAIKRATLERRKPDWIKSNAHIDGTSRRFNESISSHNERLLRIIDHTRRGHQTSSFAALVRRTLRQHKSKFQAYACFRGKPASKTFWKSVGCDRVPEPDGEWDWDMVDSIPVPDDTFFKSKYHTFILTCVLLTIVHRIS
jgi:hypothetical protein